jgi:hypothetical protein
VSFSQFSSNEAQFFSSTTAGHDTSISFHVGNRSSRVRHGCDCPESASACRTGAGCAGWYTRVGRWLGAGPRGGLHGNRCVPLPLAVALALVAAAPLAVIGGAVALGGPPAPPVAGGLLTSRGAVAGLGSGWAEPAFTALEQTAATAVRVTPQRMLPSPQPARQATRVEANKAVHACEEQHPRHKIEAERSGGPGHGPPTPCLHPCRHRHGDPLEHEECGLVALHTPDRDSEEVLVHDR